MSFPLSMPERINSKGRTNSNVPAEGEFNALILYCWWKSDNCV